MKNISVPLKLAIGIGLILLLSVMLAVNSFYSLNILTMRTTNIDKITQIDANVDALRIISAQYKATLNENYITEAQLLADQVRQNANEAKTTLTAASNHKAMDEIQADVTEYGQSFANYIQAQQAIETSIAAAVDSDNDTNTALSELNVLINGTSQQPVIHDDFYNAVTGRLVTDLIESRRTLAYTARIFIADRAEQNIEALERAYSALQDIATKLQPRLLGNAANLQTQIVTDAASYMDLLRNIITLAETQFAAEENMTRVFARVNANTDDSVVAVTALRDRDINRSQTITTRSL